MKLLRSLMLAGSLVCFNSLGLVPSITAQTGTQPASRIAVIGSSSRTPLTGSRPPQALTMDDAGLLPGETRLEGMGILFSRSAQQNADLEALIAAQQNPASPLYHQWLTPHEFGARFGMSDADLTKVSEWLEQQGFTVTGISNSRNRISFSGTASQVNSAFATELHRFTSGGKTNYAPARDLSLPSGLAESVAAVTNLSSFRPRPPVHSHPDFTSSISGHNFFTPLDVETTYDVKAAYAAGYTGAGQSIAIVGQSAVLTSDITNFQNAEGMTPKAPTMVLVPGSGVSTLFSYDQGESDLDLEYSGSIAKGATIFFVYVGDNTNYQVSDSIAYAVDNRIAPVISASYGYCEAANGQSFLDQVDMYLQQAASQGQSVIASSGDSGSSGCSGYGTIYDSTLQVAWPGSSQYVTSVGGTEVSVADDSSAAYWAPANGNDVISSALSYIPEIAWNDSGASGLGSTGGGASLYFSRPTWQTGVPGIPTGTARLVPDIALYSSGGYPGYLYCSSDTAETGVTGSCANGFRDIANDTLTVAGGTSFAAPIFAGMVAIINQATNSTGQGVLGSTLYPLAANPTTYASAFHDVTSGNNECPASSGLCSSATEGAFTTNVGYDEVTGLGSVDLFKLIAAWPRTANSALVAATTTLTPATLTPGIGTSDLVTVTVAPAVTGSGTPTGTITLSVDGTPIATPLHLSGGAATYTFSANTAGNHVITANYSGDQTFAANTSSLVLNLAYIISTVTLTPATQNPANGVADPISITVAPASANSGTTATPGGSVSITVDGLLLNPAIALTNGATTYTLLSSAVGLHVLSVGYSGDSVFAPSTGTFNYTINAPKTNSSLTVSAASATVASGASDKVTIAVAPAAGGSSTTPTGTVSVSVDGTVVNAALSLTSGSASYAFSSTVAGQHTVSATYSGDSSYLTSTGSTTVTVSAAPAFTLSATNVTLTAGSTGTSTVTVTPQNGYTGTIGWKLSGNPTVANACYTIPNTTVSGSSNTTATVTINTSSSACTKGFISGSSQSAAVARPSSRGSAPALALFAAVGVVFFARRRRGLGALLSLTILGAILTLTVTGCGSSGTTVTTPPPPTYPTATGTYTLTLIGTDTVSTTITATTNFTLTVQ